MKAEKKITIKVKSKVERGIMEDPKVEMISEWNIKRILSAVLVLLIFIIIPAYYFSYQDDKVKSVKSSPQKNESNIKQQDSVNEILTEETASPTSDNETISKKTLEEEPVALVSPDKAAVQTDKEIQADSVVAKEVEQQQKISNQSSATEHLNPHITQAQLALGVNKLKPYGEVDLPFLVDNIKARGIFFFTEVSNMQGSTVFHEWLKEGKSIYKLKAIIRTNKSRFYTSKLFTHRSIGQWQVRIITDQGEVLHNIDFSVENK